MQRIQPNVDSYTKSEKKIYELIINSPFLIEKHTIVKVAEISGSSKSAVLRFCQRLGYKGYSEFRYDMIKYLHNSPTAHTQDIGMIAHITGNYMDALRAINDIDQNRIKNLINAIKKADIIQTFGLFTSVLPAQYFRNIFQNYGKIVMISSDEITINRSAYILTSDSLVINFSASGSRGYTTSFLKDNKSIGFQSYLITCNPNALNRKYVDHTIVLPSPQQINGNMLNEHAIMLVFLEILANMYISEE